MIVILTAEPKNFVPVKLKEEAEKVGQDAKIVNISKTFIVETTGASKVMYLDDDKLIELKPPFACIPRLNEHHLLYKLNILGRLAHDGAYMLNSPASMELCNDKLGSQVKLNSEGIPTPWSCVIGHDSMLDKALEQADKDGYLKFPMVIKTLRGTHGIGVMKVDSKASLVSVAQAFLASSGAEIMLQEFIEHEESLRIIMIGDKMLAANRRGQPKEKDEFRTNAHLGSETTAYEPDEEEIALGRKIVELFGCNFCAIDYIKHNGKLLVLEVNGSPGLENIQSNYPDRNLAADVIKGLLELSQPGLAPEVIPVEQAPQQEEQPQEPGAPDDIVGSQDVPHADEPTTVVSNPNVAPLGDTEKIQIIRLADNGIDARIDTGAAFCSLHTDDISEDNGWIRIKRGEVTYKVPIERQVKIRNAHGSSSRPIIKLDIVVRGTRYNQVEFTVTSRAKMSYDVLIGRNFLKLAGLPVLVHQEGSAPSDLPPSEVEEE